MAYPPQDAQIGAPIPAIAAAAAPPAGEPQAPPAAAGPPEEGEKRGGDISIWAVILIGLLLSAVAVAAVVLLVKAPVPAGPQKAQTHLETWEYWVRNRDSGKTQFYLKIDYNTTGNRAAGSNFVDAGRGCYFEVNNTQVLGENAFASFTKSLMKRSGDIVIANRTVVNRTNATIETAISRIYAYYCVQRGYVLTATKSCDLAVRDASCTA